MKTTNKPILHNGYQVNGSEVMARIYAKNHTEIYRLKNNQFLYLFDTHIAKSNIPKYNIFELQLFQKIYFAFTSKQDFTANIDILIDDLGKTRGFDNVAGMESLKETLRQDIITPLTQKHKYEKFKITIPNGILLYGPPGCGKTFIVRKLAEEIDYTMIEVKHSDVTSPYIHGGVGKIAEVFNRAKAQSPAIMFIDELDGLMPKRRELSGNQSYKLEEINEFLMHLNDAGKNNILVIGATNQLDLIDEAILRPGRFDKKIYVPPPDFNARVHLFQMYLCERPSKNINYDDLAEQTIEYSSADIEFICDEAARIAAKMDMESIDMELLREIIAKRHLRY